MFFRRSKSDSTPVDPQALGQRLRVPAPDEHRALVLYKYDSCPYCQRVMRTIDDLGLELERRDTMRDPQARKELVAATGWTQVPCLFIDGQPLLESTDIIEWLRSYAEHGAQQA